ncbi:hypothetical protein ACEWY4_022812 [Coilia grayii]|uniref:C-type lectin domain-containing protein n=1 Tax=Coilia grayii TaxID=363190 RepID=A0ABD1J176_9TELE
MDDDIYVNSEDLNLQEMSSAQPRTRTSIWAKTGPPPLPSGAADRCCRWTAVCLGLLCVLLLGLSIGLAAWLLTQRDQLLTNHSNLLKERDQLLTNHSNLLKERDQLLTNHSNLLKERDQLLTNHSNLLRERDQLLRYKLCYEGVENPRCPPGWEVFKCNCYHNKKKLISWSDSRQYCQSLGGDLVIVKTPEKQRFITEKKYAGWIGLRKGEKNRTWTWLDNTPVSTWYWHPGEPNSDLGNCVVIHEWGTTNNTWYDSSCNSGQWSLCEKPAFTQN